MPALKCMNGGRKVLGKSIYQSISNSLSTKYDFINSGIFLDLSYFQDDHYYNSIQIKFDHEQSINTVIKELGDLKYLKITHSRPEVEFYSASAHQIYNLLIVFQSLLSVLVIMSIVNIFSLMIYESREDIKVLKSIGYSKSQVALLFFLIAFLIGIYSIIISLFVGYLLVASVFSFLSAVIKSTIIIPILSPNVLSYVTINGIVVSLISVFYPVYKEIL